MRQARIYRGVMYDTSSIERVLLNIVVRDKNVEPTIQAIQGALYGDWHQLWIQIVATVVSIVFSTIVTFILFKVVDKLVGIRVDKRVEEEGLDIYEHGESAYSN